MKSQFKIWLWGRIVGLKGQKYGQGKYGNGLYIKDK
jgi:hypothetical protein